MEEEKEIIGRTIIASDGGYEPDNFRCYAILNDELADDLSLQEPGVVLEIMENREGDKCFGIIGKAKRISERSVVSEDLSGEGSSGKEPITSHVLELKTFRESGVTAPVGRHDIKIGGPTSVRLAYGVCSEGIPVGLYSLPSGIPPQRCVVNLSQEFLLGPEAAHLNIGGKSGFAKTAFALFCCRSILSDNELGQNTSVIAFNVKADDLLWVDKKNPELEDEDKELYKNIGLVPTPFQNTKLFAPECSSKDGSPRSLRSDVEAFSWIWEDLKDQAEAVVPEEEWNPKFDSLISDLKSIEDIKDFDDVVETLKEMQGKQGSWVKSPSGSSHHESTVSKGIRVFEGISESLKGLIGGNANPLPIDQLLEPGRFSVIDIEAKGLPLSGKRLILAKVKSEVLRKLEKGMSNVDKVIFLIDELNKFAPKGNAYLPIREEIKDIAERGRSIGAILFGLEQYPSQISDTVTGNASTMVYARMKPTELDAALYRSLSKERKEAIQRLRKGFAIIDHDDFNEPILVRFPRPPCSQKKPHGDRNFPEVS